MPCIKWRPQNSKTHCSGLVALRLSCLARHGRAQGKGCCWPKDTRKEKKKKEEETTVPECLHIAYAHSLRASFTTQTAGIPRSVRIYSVHFLAVASDGDFTAHMAAWVFTIPAWDMCLRIGELNAIDSWPDDKNFDYRLILDNLCYPITFSFYILWEVSTVCIAHECFINSLKIIDI